MITLLTGDNSFEINEAVRSLVTAFEGTPEKIDGTALELRDLPDLLMGGTLFAEKRLVIIRDIASNTRVWEKLPEWLPRLSDDIHLVLIDQKPDKRTTAFKELKKLSDVKEFNAWSDRDYHLAQQWLEKRAASQHIFLDKKSAHRIVERVGLDQWQLAQALEKASLLDAITVEAIDSIIDASPSENVFQLFEIALEGNTVRLHDMLRTLELAEEPYKLFALLSSQVFQFVGVVNAGSDNNASKELAIHPFVASKLSRYAGRIGKGGASRLLHAFAQADADMKLSKADPWLLIERALLSLR